MRVIFAVIARSEATKQSSLYLCVPTMDCFAEPVIGRRFAPTRWLSNDGSATSFFAFRLLFQSDFKEFSWRSSNHSALQITGSPRPGCRAFRGTAGRGSCKPADG